MLFYIRMTRHCEGSNGVGNVASSEIRQSLWLNPQAGVSNSNIDNSVWGYYADGFFDRRQISNNKVSATTNDVAYIGNLFYNTNTNASLFFPAAGNRKYASDNTAGNLQFAGNNGYYWTSSTGNSNSSWFLTVSSSVVSMSYQVRAFGMVIRCVKE